MCGNMLDIPSATANTRRRKKKKERRNHRAPDLMAVNDDVIVALRSLSTTAEFLISLGLLQNWRKLHVAEFIASLFYEKMASKMN